MKKFLLITSLILLLVLVFSITEAFVLPVDAKALAGVTPGAKATEKAIEKANEAAEDEQGNPAKQNFKGTIDTITAGDRMVLKLADGSTAEILLNNIPKIKIPGNGKKTNGVTTLQAGMTVVVQATLNAENELVARQVHLVPGKPAQLHRVGIVDNYTPFNPATPDVLGSITVKGADGSTTFKISADTKILPKGRADLLAKGATVTVIIPRIFAGDLVAKGIVVHPAGAEQEPQEQESPEQPGTNG